MNIRKITLAVFLAAAAGAGFAQSSGPTPAPSAGAAPAPCPAAPCGPGGGRVPGMHHPQGHHGAMLRFLDTDHDGQLSRAEVQAGQQRQLEMFDKADTNGDGKLSPEEMRALRGRWRDLAPGGRADGRGGPCTPLSSAGKADAPAGK